MFSIQKSTECFRIKGSDAYFLNKSIWQKEAFEKFYIARKLRDTLRIFILFSQFFVGNAQKMKLNSKEKIERKGKQRVNVKLSEKGEVFAQGSIKV